MATGNMHHEIMLADRHTDMLTAVCCTSISGKVNKKKEGCRSLYVLSFSLQHMHHTAELQLLNGPLSGTTQVSRYQKDKTSLDLLEQER